MKMKEIFETEANDLPEQVVWKYEEMAKQEREQGGDVQIDAEGKGAIHLIRSDGVEFHLAGLDADEMLENIPANINPDDYLLAVSRRWEEGQFDDAGYDDSAAVEQEMGADRNMEMGETNFKSPSY